MKKLILSSMLILTPFFSGCTPDIVEEGTVNVSSSMGQVDKIEQTVGGPYFYWWFFEDYETFGVKELAIALENLTAQTRDNDPLVDYDVTVYFQPSIDKVADTYAALSNSSLADNDGVKYIGAGRVKDLAREAAYSQASLFGTFEINTKREDVANGIKDALNKSPSINDIGIVTNVTVRSILPDESTLEAARKATQQEKANERLLEEARAKLERTKIQEEQRVSEARGIAEANAIISKSLTPEYLQFEHIKAMKDFAASGANTVVVPANTAPLINIGVNK